MEVNGPSFVILPTDPPTCLAVSSGAVHLATVRADGVEGVVGRR